jgi:hypothetical protein
MGIVAHGCHPKVHGKLRLEGLQFQTKKWRDPISMKKLGMVIHSYYLCNSKEGSRAGWSRQKIRPPSPK